MTFTSCLDIPIHKIRTEAQRAMFLILGGRGERRGLIHPEVGEALVRVLGIDLSLQST